MLVVSLLWGALSIVVNKSRMMQGKFRYMHLFFQVDFPRSGVDDAHRNPIIKIDCFGDLEFALESFKVGLDGKTSRLQRGPVKL